METLGWIIVNIAIIGGFILLAKWLMKPSRDQVEATAKYNQMKEELYYRDFKFNHYPVEGINGVSEKDTVKMARQQFRDTKTKGLRVYLSQYNEMIRRIENNHPDTIKIIGADNKDLHLELAKANRQFVQDELRRRGENPF